MSDEKRNGDPVMGGNGEEGNSVSDPEMSGARPLVLREGDEPAVKPGAPSAGAASGLPAPTHADWRQLSDDVRRLAAQIANGRA